MADPFNPKLLWSIGLIASNGKYLTKDSFGDKLHPTSVDMRKKQIFTLDPQGDFVYLQAPGGGYMQAGQKGELGLNESPGTEGCNWTIEAKDDGKWAIKSSFGYYLQHHGETTVDSFGRGGTDKELWTVHLAIHPQVCIRNNNRSSYMHLENGSLNVNELIPWGVDALINIGYHDGRYSLQSSNGKYLKKNGDLVDAVDSSCLYVLVIKDDQVAFRTEDGKFLQTTGSPGKVHAKQSEITKNEMFQLEDSHPQVTLLNSGKFVTWKQGNDVKAIHEGEIADTEIFQMEIHRGYASNAPWSFRNNKGAYLTMKDGALYTSETQERDENSWFSLGWNGNRVVMQCANGKFLSRAPNGGFKASADQPDDTCQFTMTLDNRPQLVLRCDFGFLAIKQIQGKNLVRCNGANPEIFALEAKDGKYALKAGGAYATLLEDGSLSLSGASPEWFFLEFLVHTKFALKAEATGKYLTAKQSGELTASANKAGPLQLFEF